MTLKLPFYAKAALIFIASYAFIYGLYICQNILIPLLYAILIAILLNPLVNFIHNKKISLSISILISITFLLLIIGFISFFISTQISIFVDNYPELKIKMESSSVKIIHWASQYFNVKTSKINMWVKETKDGLFSDSGIFLGRTLMTVGTFCFVFLLFIVYLYFILAYKTLFLEFIRQMFKSVHHSAVIDVMYSIKTIIRRYLVGLSLEALIMAVLNSIGLLILDIDFAIVIGITGAIVNIIPYFGGMIAIALPMTIAFVTKDSSSYPLLVLGIYLIIQFIDNHFIIPVIVASKVKLNALVTMLVVLSGGALWGISGMFLSIPLTAILKVIFDHIDILKPWGFLMGNIVPTESKFNFLMRKKT
ncbi:MAG: AI-2E family transporter [Saprospiraceae bacterium]